MSSKLRSLLSGTVLVGGVLVGGWALMVSLSPSKEQMMERLSIDADEAMAISQKRNKQLFEVIQQNVQSSDPVWKVKPLQIEKQSPGASVKDDVE